MSEKYQSNVDGSVYQKELLAPGGDADSVKAAILAGADAVYCGVKSFNARQRANNLSSAELRELIIIAHKRSCRVYLTLNTLIVEDELHEVLALVDEVIGMGIDALIVQDLGLLYLVNQYFPQLEMHASTQLTTHNAGQLGLLASLGISQVNLCRELSLPEITALVDAGKKLGLKSEVFVHGAFCIAFSGQCYMSSALCGHSGNRGKCVQPCRRAYVQGQNHSRISPFNLKDNALFSSADKLVRAGVHAFKIEGRIKGFKYVYATVQSWRRQLDSYLRHGTIKQTDPTLAQVFNRDYTDGYLTGNITKSMFNTTSRDQSLIPIASVVSYTADTGVLKCNKEIAVDAETTVLIYKEDFTFVCTGKITGKISRYEFRLKIEHKLKGKIVFGDKLYKQDEFAGLGAVKEAIDALQVEKQPLLISLQGVAGEPLKATFTAEGLRAVVRTATALLPAVKAALTPEKITEKMSMLGTTNYKLQSLDATRVAPGLFLPIKEINALRRSGIDALAKQRGLPPERVAVVLPERTANTVANAAPELVILIDDEKDMHMQRSATTRLFFELPVTAGENSHYYGDLFSRYPDVYPWFPAILIDEDYTAACRLLHRLHPKLILSDNSGIGREANRAAIPWVAGALLNSTNSYALEALKKHGGCSGACISPELSREQMQMIVPPEQFASWYLVYSPLMLMNTRQCLIRNCQHCPQQEIVDVCIRRCSKKLTVHDTHHNPFYLVKRPGFYQQVYNGRHYCNLAVVEDMQPSAATFVADMRRIPSQTVLGGSREILVEHLEGYIAGDSSRKVQLEKMVQTTTAGQYTRGL